LTRSHDGITSPPLRALLLSAPSIASNLARPLVKQFGSVVRKIVRFALPI